MDRWGLLNRLAATNCPPIALNMIFDVGPFALKGGVLNTNRGRGGFCPRRTVLDKLLVDAAVESGAELREKFTVEEAHVGRGPRGRRQGTQSERRLRSTNAREFVIGADGVHSVVAKAVAGSGVQARFRRSRPFITPTTADSTPRISSSTVA